MFEENKVEKMAIRELQNMLCFPPNIVTGQAEL